MLGEGVVGGILGLGIGGGAALTSGVGSNANVLDTSKSATSGQPASSTVPSSYDDAPLIAGGQVGSGNTLTETSSMDVIAAQEIINSLASENGAFIGDGGIETNVINNLADATGLSFEELSSMVENANTGTLGGQTFALNEKTVTDANLTDEVTGLGGQSNIQVTQNADGTTTLFNPTGGISGTGRTTIVEQGEDLANAIAVFDEVTTTDTSALSNAGSCCQGSRSQGSG